MTKLRLGVLASGTGSNLDAIGRAISEGRVQAEIAIVLTNKRDAGALQVAAKHGAPGEFIDPAGSSREAHEQKIIERLGAHDVDLVVLAGYMRILTPGFVNRYANRIVNIHPALLPAFKGVDGQGQAHAYGVKIAGCTTHFVTEDMDAGPIILQAACPVLEDDTPDALRKRILALEHEIYPRTIQLIAEGRVHVDGQRVRIDDAKADAGAHIISPEG